MSDFFEQTIKIPILETERLRLREFRLEDFKNFLAATRDPQVMRHISGKQQTEEEIWMRYLRGRGHWALFGFGNWVLIEKETGAFVGTGGLAYYKRQFEPSLTSPLRDMPEIGYVLAASAHGKGYATEAMQAALVWFDANFNFPQTICLIDEQNTASLRVAEKLGYREFERVSYKEALDILLARTKRIDAKEN